MICDQIPLSNTVVHRIITAINSHFASFRSNKKTATDLEKLKKSQEMSLGYAEKLSYREDVGTVGMPEKFDSPKLLQGKVDCFAYFQTLFSLCLLRL